MITRINYLLFILKILLVFFYFCSSIVYSKEERAYEIQNIKIILDSKNASIGRELAKEKAIKLAFSKLLQWILNHNDYKKLFIIDSKMDEIEIKKFVRSYQINNESFTNNSYRAEFSIMFDKLFINEWLIFNKINFLEKKSPTLLVIPILELDKRKVLWDDPNLWRLLWQNESAGKHFIPLIFPHGDAEDLINLSYEDVSLLKIKKLVNFASRYGLSYILIPYSKVFINNQDHYEGVFGAVIIAEDKEKKFFEERILKSYPGEILDDFLLRAVKIISNKFDEYWLEHNIQDAKKIYFNVSYDDLREWRFVIDTLQNLDEVSEVKILSLSINNAYLEVYISYQKESELLRLLKNSRIDVQNNSENQNLYNLGIITNFDNESKIELNKKNKSEVNSDILVIE